MIKPIAVFCLCIDALLLTLLGLLNYDCSAYAKMYGLEWNTVLGECYVNSDGTWVTRSSHNISLIFKK